LESRQNSRRVDAKFDQLDGDRSLHRRQLFGAVDDAHAAASHLFEQLVVAESLVGRK
jgi:hypothetical protein